MTELIIRYGIEILVMSGLYSLAFKSLPDLAKAKGHLKEICMTLQAYRTHSKAPLFINDMLLATDSANSERDKYLRFQITWYLALTSISVVIFYHF